MQFQSGTNPLDTAKRMPTAQNQLDFAEVLGKKTGRQLGRADEGKIREAAENFVAVAFVQPVFKQLRAANHAAAPFGPNKAEQQFQSLVDAQVSKHIVHKSKWPVVERVAQQMLKKAGLAPAPTAD
jgi:Rod binding domain-containing protein